MVEGLYLFFAFLYFFSELISSVKIFADIRVLCKLFDFFQLLVNLDKLFVEDFFLIFKFFR